jgi:opacity protein-like surface antigen
MKIAAIINVSVGLMMLFGISAQAQELQDSKPWQGAYIGIMHGSSIYGTQRYSQEFSSGYQYSAGRSLTGLVLGVQGKYLWQYDKYVYGLGMDYTHNNISPSHSGDIRPVLSRNFNFYGQAGYSINDKFMIFTKVGISSGLARFNDYYYSNETKTAWGMSFSSGVEYKLNSKFSIFVDYSYTYFAPVQNQFDGPYYAYLSDSFWPGYSRYTQKITNDFSLIKLGVNYKF